MKNVREIMNNRLNRGVYTVVPDQSVLSAAQLMWSKNVGALVVTHNHEILGLISERDMLKNVLRPGLDPRDVSVGQIMSPHVITVSPDETWEDCLTKMRTTRCRHLPVLEDGRLIGMISLREVLGIDEAEILDTYMWNPSARGQETGVRGTN